MIHETKKENLINIKQKQKSLKFINLYIYQSTLMDQ